MNAILFFLTGFGLALFYSRGKADPVQSLKVDAKRCARKSWGATKRQYHFWKNSSGK